MLHPFTPATALWAGRQRRLYRRKCVACGILIAGIAIRRYCSGRCRTAAWRARLLVTGRLYDPY